MPHSKPHAATAAAPTPFADLNALLAELTARLRALFGETLVGLYLQGSFALGDFDAHSDVDFLAVLAADVSAEELTALQALHDELHTAPNPWARRLEGSYAPAAVLRAWSTAPRDPPGDPPRPADWADPGAGGAPPRAYPFLFKGNGERQLVRSEHDNTQVVRWVTRRAGVALHGPPAETLIDPVDPDALRAEVAEVMRRWGGQLLEGGLDTAWLQAFAVVIYCRMLQTLRTGTVTSKKTAVAWGQAALDKRWRGLIARAWARRPDPEAQVGQPADPEEAAETLAFVRYAIERAERPAADPLARLRRAGKPPKPERPAELPKHPDRRDARGFIQPGRGGRPPPPPVRPGGRGRRLQILPHGAKRNGGGGPRSGGGGEVLH